MEPDIGRESRFLPTPPAFDTPVRGPRRNISITFGVEKLDWCGSRGERSLKIYLFVLTEYTNVTDRQTDGQTPHDDIGRAYATSLRKNYRLHLTCVVCVCKLPCNITSNEIVAK